MRKAHTADAYDGCGIHIHSLPRVLRSERHGGHIFVVSLQVVVIIDPHPGDCGATTIFLEAPGLGQNAQARSGSPRARSRLGDGSGSHTRTRAGWRGRLVELATRLPIGQPGE